MWGGGAYVSFSGGKDSTVLLDLTRRIDPDIPAVFVDTGLEYPEIRDFVKSIDKVVWLRPEMSFRKVIQTYGFPVGSKRTAYNIERGRAALQRGDIEMYEHYVCGKRYGKKDGQIYRFMALAKRFKPLFDSDIKVSNKCCDIMKKRPMHIFQNESHLNPIVATMAEESQQRRLGWLRTGCNAFDIKDPISKPMSFWTEQDVLNYLKRFNIPYASIYGDIVEEEGKLKTTGANRTGCMFCMFGIHLEKQPNRFQRMANTHPKQYDYCINNLGCGKVLDCISVPYKPIENDKS